ncbi:MAG: hypothetical protein JST88_09735 [Bacteroidetes bacterium]|nr:hypothetical protein [Bacteroidota bacterium]
MKRIFFIKLSMVATVLMLALLPQQQAKAQPGMSVSFQTFYNELSPYGQWINDPQYGYVWAPDVDQSFRPYYSDGRWAMTEYGNTWISNYEWGWAAFHYGRWMYDNYYGWIWVPGTQWGPAWVSWRSGGGYYGWAPMSPGINISISFGGYMPSTWWTFIPCGQIYNPYFYNYWRGTGYNTTYINRTTIINNYYHNQYVYGPRRQDIERYTGGRVTVYNIRNQQRPGPTAMQRNQVAMYRPSVTESNAAGARRGAAPAPESFVRSNRVLGNERDAQNNANQSIRSENSNGVRDMAQPGRVDRSTNQMDRTGGDTRVNGNLVQPSRSATQNSELQQAPRGGQHAVSSQQIQADRQQQIQAQREQQMQAQRQQQIQADRQQQMQAQREQQMQAQREQQMQAQREQQMQAQREQQMQAQREQQMQAQREQQMQAQREQQMQAQREQQMQAQREQQMQAQRQQQMQAERQQQQMQREWRRSDPQMERTQPVEQRGGFGGGRR